MEVMLCVLERDHTNFPCTTERSVLNMLWFKRKLKLKRRYLHSFLNFIRKTSGLAIKHRESLFHVRL